jgi:DNA-binding transcriptional MerR regulator
MVSVSLSQSKRASEGVVLYIGVMAAPVRNEGRSDQTAGEFTIDELAARTGLTVRTVRFYATEGLLPPPQRRGRVAYYGQAHRLRLELIRSLQDHGYTLAAIERVLARVPFDAEPAQYAVQSAVLAPWLPEAPELYDRAGLERRVGGRISDEELGYLEQVGALERVAEDSFRTSPAVLGHALELMKLPVPTSVLHDSAAIIDEHATAVAEGLTDVFIKAIWGPYQQGELDSEQVVAMLARLRPLAVQGLVSAFGRAADRAARRGLDRPT